MANYNSLTGLKQVEKKQEESKRVTEAVTTNATVKKKTKLQKFIDSFLKEDIGTVRDFVVGDVIIPAIKKTFIESVTSGLNLSLLGDSKAGRVPKASKVSYNRMSDYDRDPYSLDYRYASRSYDFDAVIFPEYAEAKEVLDRMYELLGEYHVVRVADYYDLANVTGRPYTDNRYGWTSLGRAEIIDVRGGYMIRLPRALPID